MRIDGLAGLLLCGVLVACTGSPGSAPIADAGNDVAADPPPAEHDFCCQVTVDLTDDPYWQNCSYGCYPDAAPSPRNIPWICNIEQPTSCDDPACGLGSTCRGFNGTGIVQRCDAGGPPSTSLEARSLCP